jgi:hypothetical protein
MGSASSLVAKAVGTVALLFLARAAVWIVYTFFVRPATDPLRFLAGPDGSATTVHLDEVSEYVSNQIVTRRADLSAAVLILHPRPTKNGSRHMARPFGSMALVA